MHRSGHICRQGTQQLSIFIEELPAQLLREELLPEYNAWYSAVMPMTTDGLLGNRAMGEPVGYRGDTWSSHWIGVTELGSCPVQSTV